MTVLRPEFNAIAAKKAGAARYPAPFSLRLTHEERALLLAAAGRKPIVSPAVV
jgi:hypothetical protein